MGHRTNDRGEPSYPLDGLTSVRLRQTFWKVAPAFSIPAGLSEGMVEIDVPGSGPLDCNA